MTKCPEIWLDEQCSQQVEDHRVTMRDGKLLLQHFWDDESIIWWTNA